jgi:hypothetical protein
VISAVASVAGTKATITLNGVQVIKDVDFGTNVIKVTKTVNVLSGNNMMLVDVRGTTGKTITIYAQLRRRVSPHCVRLGVRQQNRCRCSHELLWRNHRGRGCLSFCGHKQLSDRRATRPNHANGLPAHSRSRNPVFRLECGKRVS